VSPDASNLGFKDYRVWFHFGIRGLRKGSFFRITLMNLSNLKLFGSAIYRPVWKTLPSQPEWQRTRTDSTFQANPPNGYKLSWVFEMPFEDNVVYFAFAPPYPYEEVLKTIEACQEACPPDALLYRETLARSLDNRNIDLLTISNKENFKQKREARQELLFPTHQPRCYAGTKPVVFATARVHPGETPASFMMDGFLKAVLALDKKGYNLRKNFVFKIIPILNPDGVFRGHYRVDQNGRNLNRFYQSPCSETPSIYAAKTYFEYLYYTQPGVSIYLDFHAQASKRSCFVFGNNIKNDSQVENELFAKLIELNSQYFEYSECDFSERSMSTKDPKDQKTKEGSGRVALHKSTGVIMSYTVECSYYIPRQLHSLPNLPNKRRSKVTEPRLPTIGGVYVFNRQMFDNVGQGLAYAILDYHNINPCSRLPLSEFKNLDNIRSNIKKLIELRQRRATRGNYQKSLNQILTKRFEKSESLQYNRKPIPRMLHKVTKVSPVFSFLNNTAKPTLQDKLTPQSRVRSFNAAFKPGTIDS